MQVPPPLQRDRKAGEDTRQHRALLLWCMQAEERRSNRAISRALNCGESTVRLWRSKYEWERRIEETEAALEPSGRELAAVASDHYAERYHTVVGGREVKIIAKNMEVPYRGPNEEEKSQLAKAVDLYEKVEREQALAQFLKDSKERKTRLKLVLDATLGRIGQAIRDQTFVAKPGDLGQVIRGYQLIESIEQRQLNMLPSGSEDALDGAGGTSVQMSQRVLQAQASGGDVLEAAEQDAEELLLMIRTMRTHEQTSNVVPFPGQVQDEPAEGGG